MIRLKKMMALAIAVVMVICTMNFTVFADPNSGDLSVNGNLTVSGIGENDVVDYYQLLKWDTDETTGDPVNGWVWGDGVDPTKMELEDGTLLTVADIIGTTDGENKITAEKAGALAKGADTAMTTPAGSNSGGTWTAKGVPAGLYMVIITSKTPGTMYNPIFVAANFYGNNEQPDSSNTWAVTSDLTYSNEGMAKKSVIPVEKEATSSEDGNPDTVDVGEEVDYTITTKIPKFASNYIDPVFQIDDTLTGLELKAAPVVKAGSATLTEGTEYTMEAGGAAGDSNFSIKFTKTYLDSVAAAGQDITVEYTAIVNDTAELVINQEINTVDIKFSTDPTDTEGHGLLRDQTNHFTFSIDADFMADGSIDESSTDAIKIGVDKEGNPIMSEQSYATSTAVHAALAGAVFQLFTDEGCAEADIYKNDIYPNGCEVTSDDTGRLTIKGLDAGNYWLKEKTAPAGFVKMQDPIPVTIVATITDEVKVDYEYDADGTPVEVTYYTNRLDGYTVTIGNASTTYEIDNSTNTTITNFERDPDSSDSELVNTKGVELPATGGMGTTIFYVIGAILVLGAGILLVTRRRMDTF